MQVFKRVLFGPPGKIRVIRPAAIAFGTYMIGRETYRAYVPPQRMEGAQAMHSIPIELAKRLPLRGLSRLWGTLSQMELSPALRGPVLGFYAKTFRCNLDEMDADGLESFKSLGDFFARRLKDGARPISSAHLVSPVDGRVQSCGVFTSHDMEKVKGVDYTLAALLGKDSSIERSQLKREDEPDGKQLYHCVIYLAPGDYHGIHAPADFDIKLLRHFPGLLFPVAPLVVNAVKGLFELNERVALEGRWEHGNMAMVPVGAYNVGNITVSFDKNIKTNQKWDGISAYDEKKYGNLSIAKGSEVAFFLMGSTVVLLFEAPRNFKFHVEGGQWLRLGEPLGSIATEEA